MATVLYSAMLPEVQPHAHSAPEPMVINAIRNAAIEFCERSWVWQIVTPNMGITANTQDYTLDLSAVTTGAAVAEIMQGYYKDKPIIAVSEADIILDYPTWRTRTGTTPLRFMGKDVQTKVSLVPIPSTTVVAATALMYFKLAIKPTRSSTGLPDFIYEKYLEDIAHGAVARLVMVPHKPYSNANMALSHRKLFDDAIAKARVDSSKSFTRATLRSRVSGVARW